MIKKLPNLSFIFFSGNKNYWLFVIRLHFPHLLLGKKKTNKETGLIWSKNWLRARLKVHLMDVIKLFEIEFTDADT